MDRKYIEAIEHARVYDVAVETPLELAPKLSRRLHNEIFLKREDLQPVFSFKLRGAYNKIAKLDEEDCKKGVLCASAGNHAQGVALAAHKRDCSATIVMPRTTPDIKVHAVQAMGATVVLAGDNYSDANHHALKLLQESDMVFVHPYDDPDVIAGQGTVAEEILRQSPKDIDVVFVPVGGGGLISGMAVYLKNISRATRVIGVEPVDSAAMYHSIEADHIVELDQVGIFADGVAVKKVGTHTFDLTRRYVDEIILVEADEICAAIKDLFDENRSIVEPAGALATAAMKSYVEREDVHGKTMVCINSGANMNFDRLRHVAERAEIGEERETLFAVTIPEKSGAFLNFCRLIGHRVITEFNYRLSMRDHAHIFVGIRTQDKKEAFEIQKTLTKHGHDVVNLHYNELAKLHIRHLVGGRSRSVKDEVLYRFEFPERPGALLEFLTRMAGRWNISLFHYRNHGADFGRVLAGMEVPSTDRVEFQTFLDELGYSYTEETANPAYHLFL
ncbi:MAG: threonine ammonia-lyase, biosynthetic, partial [Mariprofundaceae bacterium]